MKFSKALLFLKIGILCLVSGIRAQQSVGFQRLTTGEGLSHNQVRSIVQDTTGFIWIGTTNGLQRYDGKNLITFKYDHKEKNSIGQNNVRTLYADSKGGVWIGTRGGGLDYYLNGTFTHYYHDPNDPGSISDNTVECIAEDHDGNLWIGTRKGGLNKFENGQFTKYQYDPTDTNSISHNAVFSVLIDSQNRVWAGTYGGGLCLYDKGKFKRFVKQSGASSSICSNFIVSLLEGDDGEIWIGSWQGGLSILKNGRFTNLSPGDWGLNNNSVLSITHQQDKIWIGTWGGGISYYQDGMFHPYTNKVGDLKSLGSNFIESLFVDRQGFLWIGTYGGGVNRFSKYNFITFRHKPYQNSLSNGYVNDVLEASDGALMIGTLGGGLNHYKDGKFTVFMHDPNDPTSLSDKSNTVWTIEEGRDGTFWIGSENGLDIFKDGKFENYKFTNEKGAVLDNIFYCMTASDDGGVLIGTWNGDVLKFNNGEFIKVFGNQEKQDKGANNPIFDIEQDSDGAMWIAAAEGGGVYHVKDGATRKIEIGQKGAKYKPEVYSMHKSRNSNILWIGTIEGIYKHTVANGKVEKYDESDGLCNNGVLALEEDHKGNIWIGTMGGLSRFNPDTEVFDNYYERDGLQGDQFNRNSVFYSEKSGFIYLGGTNGFNMFHPDSVETPSFNPKVVLTKLELSYKEVKPEKGTLLEQSIENTDQITLSYKDDIFSIEYAALGKERLNEDSEYAYYLEGYEQGWNHVGNRTLATYSNIPAGDYVFKVKASNENGEWSNVAFLEVKVLPPWWETWWAKTLFLLAIIGSTYAYFKRRLRIVEERHKELEELVEIRTKDFKRENRKGRIAK